jgi:hypothetical protein
MVPSGQACAIRTAELSLFSPHNKKEGFPDGFSDRGGFNGMLMFARAF